MQSSECPNIVLYSIVVEDDDDDDVGEKVGESEMEERVKRWFVLE